MNLPVRRARRTLSTLSVALVGVACLAPAAWGMPAPGDVVLGPDDDATGVAIDRPLTMDFGDAVQAGTGNITLLKHHRSTVFTDPLNDASLLTVTTGAFFAQQSPAFDPDAIFGVNDGAGGGDFGGDTPGDRTTYNGFTGGYLEATGVQFGGTNPVVVEWQNISVSGASALRFSADFASALAPDLNDSVTIEAIIDGGAPQTVLAFHSPASDGTFAADDSGTQLTDTAQSFTRPIVGTGTSLTIRATLSLSGVASNGDDIAMDNVTVTGDTSTSIVEQVPASAANVTFDGGAVVFDPTAPLDANEHYSVTVDPGAVVDVAAPNTAFAGFSTLQEWDFTTSAALTPVVLGLSPADDAVNVAPDATFALTFDRAMQVGTGTIELRSSADGSLVESIDVTGASVTRATTTMANDTVVIDPSTALGSLTGYYLVVPPRTLVDEADASNDFAGLQSPSRWSFTSAEAAQLAATGTVSLPPAVLAAALVAAGTVLLVGRRARARGAA